MKQIPRDSYLNQLIKRRGSDFIKIITGIRRSGKSYLLDPIFRDYLIKDGVNPDHIIKIDLDKRNNLKLLDPDKLYHYIVDQIKDEDEYYILLDEIQLVPEFESVLNSFLHIKNLDVYVTGSNSRFLSTDIITEFRGRSEEIRMYPLSFAEFCEASREGIDKDAIGLDLKKIPLAKLHNYPLALDGIWKQYYSYGGLPQILSYDTDAEKEAFLRVQKDNVYLNDIVERYKIRKSEGLDTLTEIIASAIGSPTNPSKLERTFKSVAQVDLSYHRIEDYLGLLEDAFMIEKARRYDVKGKHYIDTPAKYYFTDPGLRNACVDFRQTEQTHLMENIIYNELLRRGYRVDVGVVEVREDGKRKQLEVDFVANKADRTYYIQSALSIQDLEKRAQESRSLENINNHFSKIIIAKDTYGQGHEFSGIATIGLFDFLLNEHILEQYK